MTSVLISGASIAGPALAFWLHRAGFEVTVLEKAPDPRAGGYPIDIRGSALEVVRRMGVLPDLQAAHVDTRTITFLHRDGSPVAALATGATSGGGAPGDLEVRRGDLTAILYGRVRHDVEFRFGDRITSLRQRPDGVDVTLTDGQERSFDLVIGADGLHSATRAAVFGPEEQFHHYLGTCFAGFTLPNAWGLAHEAVLWNVPGRSAALYATGDSESVHGFLSFHQPEPPFAAFRDPRAQRELVAGRFAFGDWQIPALVQAMREADDLFFDVVSQIRMPRWSSGRVALVGDAAAAPSFLTGQGTSLALVGAYLLAASLAANPDHEKAFDAYEQDTRAFVTANQALATAGGSAMHPRTEEALARRNQMLAGLSELPGNGSVEAHSAIRLPDVR
ncbi:FAD-dependent monooxygenase [Kineosporia succinea]|uniref:2-polyprenyl-6-methoxyphenol hydroxylase-like FAD-dependent oxidoreductase n=1 Tax=Kineosporia succinea TaxID=84632 RepID=A0ABT9P9Z6_9ACTN|nr:FAD-dependent monooxygenase [Kineosporia succinea]MDP9829519.1 2-polyprenyl-6-methoxyphenol hydroxylase-like FAD-dependent oxidoreductase [Kineosporia succinea]